MHSSPSPSSGSSSAPSPCGGDHERRPYHHIADRRPLPRGRRRDAHRRPYTPPSADLPQRKRKRRTPIRPSRKTARRILLRKPPHLRPAASCKRHRLSARRMAGNDHRTVRYDSHLRNDRTRHRPRSRRTCRRHGRKQKPHPHHRTVSPHHRKKRTPYGIRGRARYQTRAPRIGRHRNSRIKQTVNTVAHKRLFFFLLCLNTILGAGRRSSIRGEKDTIDRSKIGLCNKKKTALKEAQTRQKRERACEFEIFLKFLRGTKSDGPHTERGA